MLTTNECCSSYYIRSEKVPTLFGDYIFHVYKSIDFGEMLERSITPIRSIKHLTFTTQKEAEDYIRDQPGCENCNKL